jgi:hypothetical protein
MYKDEPGKQTSIPQQLVEKGGTANEFRKFLPLSAIKKLEFLISQTDPFSSAL